MKLDEKLKSMLSETVSEKNYNFNITAGAIELLVNSYTGIRSRWTALPILSNIDDCTAINLESNFDTPDDKPIDVDKCLIVTYEGITIQNKAIMRVYIVVKWITDYERGFGNKRRINIPETIFFKFE